MDRDEPYYQQVQLLFRAIPYVAREDCFALKGGTAINLFHLPMPRLSVDIDLTYLPVEDRETSLTNASAALQRITQSMVDSSPGLDAQTLPLTDGHYRALVRAEGVQIKIEFSPVTRGAIHVPVAMAAHDEVQQEFGFAEMQVLQAPDLYGGKICAALDRQHPRDLFDVKILLDSGRFTRDVFEGFLVYLICSSRPMNELLAPRMKDIGEVFTHQFEGMTRRPVGIGELVEAREKLLTDISKHMTDKDKQFLLSLKLGRPEWSLLPLAGIEQLPAVQWKLQNIRQMGERKHKELLNRLQMALEHTWPASGAPN